jgi:predicted PolB exonuclease-like 3'-5' exonuclease
MNHVIFDIETVPAESCRNDDALKLIQRRKLENKYKKPETIESHMADFVRGMSLEPGTAQVCCICASVMGKDNAFGMANQNERELLVAFADWLNKLDDMTPYFVGFNIRKFDIPVLVAAYLRKRLPIPSSLTRALLTPYSWTIDYYSLFPGTALQRFAQALGLDPLAVSGGDVAELFEQGQIPEILRHCTDDVNMVYAIHERVHG